VLLLLFFVCLLLLLLFLLLFFVFFGGVRGDYVHHTLSAEKNTYIVFGILGSYDVGTEGGWQDGDVPA